MWERTLILDTSSILLCKLWWPAKGWSWQICKMRGHTSQGMNILPCHNRPYCSQRGKPADSKPEKEACLRSDMRLDWSRKTFCGDSIKSRGQTLLGSGNTCNRASGFLFLVPRQYMMWKENLWKEQSPPSLVQSKRLCRSEILHISKETGPKLDKFHHWEEYLVPASWK